MISHHSLRRMLLCNKLLCQLCEGMKNTEGRDEEN